MFSKMTSFQNQSSQSNHWSSPGNEPEQEKPKPDFQLQFQFEKVKKLEGELATEQQRLKVIKLTASQTNNTEHISPFLSPTCHSDSAHEG